MEQIYLSIICRKNSPIQIWHRHFYHLAPSYRPKCLSTNKRIYRNVLVLFHMIIMILRRLPLKQCMVFKLERNDWKFNWKNPKMPRSLIRVNSTIQHNKQNVNKIGAFIHFFSSFFNFIILFFIFIFWTVTMCYNYWMYPSVFFLSSNLLYYNYILHYVVKHNTYFYQKPLHWMYRSKLHTHTHYTQTQMKNKLWII